MSDSEGESEFQHRNKARFRRRLQDRWNCMIPGHSHCFASIEGLHVGLSEEDIETWVSAIHNGSATLLIPPNSIVQSSTSFNRPDDASIKSLTPSSVIQYQRPSNWRSNPSLTDLRSMQTTLRGSTASFSASTASSGIPGIGYQSGKVIKWVGTQIIDALLPLEIFRRRMLIKILLKKIERVPFHRRAPWLVKKERTMNRAVEDLLELSLDCYKEKYRTDAIQQGILMKDLIEASMFEIDSKMQASLNAIDVKIFPLYLLSEDQQISGHFADDLRETLLQERSEFGNTSEKEYLSAEVATRLCFELAYGGWSSWRDEGYGTLWYLYQTPHGKANLQNLGENGVLIKDLANRAFNSAIHDTVELAGAIHFFSAYANDVHTYRRYIMSPTALPLLLQNFKAIDPSFENIDKVWYTCEILADVSALQWCVPEFIELKVALSLAKMLVFQQSQESPDGTPLFSWIGYCIVRILRNLVIFGEKLGEIAVREVTGSELLRILPKLDHNIERGLGKAAGLRMRDWIEKIWPDWRIRAMVV